LYLFDSLPGQLMDLYSFAVTVLVTIDTIDVIGGVHGVIGPGIALKLHAVAFEEHHGDVNAGIARLGEPPTDAAEVVGVAFFQVELRFSVQGQAGSGARPRMRCDGMGAVAPLGVLHPRIVPLRRLPSPTSREIVPVCLEPLQVGVEIKGRGRIAWPHVHEVRLGVGAGQKDGFAETVGKVTWILGVHAEGTLGVCGQGLAAQNERQVRDKQGDEEAGMPHHSRPFFQVLLHHSAFAKHDCRNPERFS